MQFQLHMPELVVGKGRQTIKYRLELCVSRYVVHPRTCMQNVVVVGQPSAPAQTIVHAPPRANEYLALTVVLCVICFLHCNLLAVLLLIPALICSCVVCENCNYYIIIL